MSDCQVTWDADRKIVICRMVGFVSDAEAEILAEDLGRMIQHARQVTGTLRLLMDNKDGMVFSPKATATMERLRAAEIEGDRTAVIVSSHLHRLQAMRAKSESAELFTSEAEALAWLAAGD